MKYLAVSCLICERRQLHKYFQCLAEKYTPKYATDFFVQSSLRFPLFVFFLYRCILYLSKCAPPFNTYFSDLQPT